MKYNSKDNNILNRSKNKLIRQILLFVSFAILSAILIFGYVYLTRRQNNITKIKLNFEKLEIADTPAKQELGLSNRTQICEKCGMLFPLFTDENPQVVSFWMKDCTVPIDILYLDKDNKVVTLISKPEPNNTTKTYSSLVPVVKVLEIPTSRVESLEIKEGSYLDF
jgi:uncharacterized membrane protein (UPF0127 family)